MWCCERCRGEYIYLIFFLLLVCSAHSHIDWCIRRLFWLPDVVDVRREVNPLFLHNNLPLGIIRCFNINGDSTVSVCSLSLRLSEWRTSYSTNLSRLLRSNVLGWFEGKCWDAYAIKERGRIMPLLACCIVLLLATLTLAASALAPSIRSYGLSASHRRFFFSRMESGRYKRTRTSRIRFF